MLVRDVQLHVQNLSNMTPITTVGKITHTKEYEEHWLRIDDIPKAIYDCEVTYFNIEYDRHGVVFKIVYKKGEQNEKVL